MTQPEDATLTEADELRRESQRQEAERVARAAAQTAFDTLDRAVIERSRRDRYGTSETNFLSRDERDVFTSQMHSAFLQAVHEKLGG